MKKYAIVINEETKQCDVGLATDEEYYKSEGMTLQEVEQAYDGGWYLKGYAPEKPQSLINQERIKELKKNLSKTDYITAKIAEGSATKEEYADVIAQRQVWRDEINDLQRAETDTSEVVNDSQMEQLELPLFV